MRRTRTALACMLCLAVGCGAPARFALRPTVWRDTDDRDFAPAPHEDEEQDITNTVDVTLLRPLTRWMLFEPGTEAVNVNALDEVADSTWFTNRTPSEHEMALGACPEAEPVPPFMVQSTKVGGTTAGLVIEDATGAHYVAKVDGLAPRQPEISTAADVIVSRLYWAIGFNVPCNRIVFTDAHAFQRAEDAVERLDTGEGQPLTQARLDEILARATRSPDGALRFGFSRFIDGDPLGTWRAEGTREDDPNDVVPHEDRRELRGERLLAAWVAHWDSRGPQSFDAFVHASETQGHVVHYFLDFSDSLGATPTRTPWAEPRMGYETVSDAPTVVVDVVGFGLVRRPWDEVRVDPRYPNLGFFDVAHFDPMGFAPQTPLARWERAQAADLGWMARRLAHLDPARIRTAVQAGRLSDAAEEQHLVELLLQRRERALAAAFALSSPLGDVTLEGERLCASDLAVEAGLSPESGVGYSVALRGGAAERPIPAELEQTHGRVCVPMPHFAPEGLPDDDASRYAVLRIDRTEGDVRTSLFAYLYDLGHARGHVLVGVERP